MFLRKAAPKSSIDNDGANIRGTGFVIMIMAVWYTVVGVVRRVKQDGLVEPRESVGTCYRAFAAQRLE